MASGKKKLNLFAGKGVPLRYSALAIGCGYLAVRYGYSNTFISILSGYASLNFAMIGYFTYYNSTPTSVIGKDPLSGKLAPWSYVVWLPFHLVNQVFVNVARVINPEHASEVSPNFMLVLGTLIK